MNASSGGGSSNMDRRTDSGWITSSTLAQAAMIAVAGINTAAAISMNAKQVSIANGYLQLAQQLQSYWLSVFVPCETKIVTEACGTPIYQPQYDLTAGRYVASVRQQFRKKMDDVRCISRYCTNLSAAMVKDMAIAEATAVGNAQNYAYRYEEARKEAKDDVRFSRIMTALGLGRNLPMQALAYSKAAGGMLGTLGQQAGQGAAGALSALGYSLNRNQTEYPTNQGYQTPTEDVAPTSQVPIPPPRPEFSTTPPQQQNYNTQTPYSMAGSVGAFDREATVGDGANNQLVGNS